MKKKIIAVALSVLMLGTIILTSKESAFAGTAYQAISGTAAGADELTGTHTASLSMTTASASAYVNGSCITYRYLQVYGTIFNASNSGCGAYNSGRVATSISSSVSASASGSVVGGNTPVYLKAYANVDGTLNPVLTVNR